MSGKAFRRPPHNSHLSVSNRFRLLDGGNRYRACLEVGVEPRFEEYEGDDLIHFVVSSNLHRRHLSQGQRATIVAMAQDWSEAQTRGGTGANQHTKEQTGTGAGLLSDQPTSTADRAQLATVGRETQKKADKLVRTQPPEVIKQVLAGEAIEGISMCLKKRQRLLAAIAKPPSTTAREYVLI